eukprot:COSAG04_NODE_859_length_9813_cov_35.427836_3_plen_222_part_00
MNSPLAGLQQLLLGVAVLLRRAARSARSRWLRGRRRQRPGRPQRRSPRPEPRPAPGPKRRHAAHALQPPRPRGVRVRGRRAAAAEGDREGVRAVRSLRELDGRPAHCPAARQEPSCKQPQPLSFAMMLCAPSLVPGTVCGGQSRLARPCPPGRACGRAPRAHGPPAHGRTPLALPPLRSEGSAQSAEQDRKRLKFARPKRQAPPQVGRRCQATRMLVLCVV